MHSAATERLEFAPPPVKGSLRALALALTVHLLLIAALTWGVHWKHTDEAASFEAELWSASAQQAAPAEPSPTPPQPAAEQPETRPEPTPPAPVPAPPRPAPVPPAHPVKAPQTKPAPPAHEADIALEKEKEKKRQQLAQKAAELEQTKKLQEKQQAELQAQQDKERQKKKEQDFKAQQVLEKEKLAADNRRLVALARMQGIAATGGTNATGSSAKSSGPSANYKGRLSAVFKRNISFSNIDSIQGNPKAVVQVKVSPNGLIISFNLTKSSGVPAWDDAVLRAVEKTERIPLDEDGKVVPEFPVQFGPKD